MVSIALVEVANLNTSLICDQTIQENVKGLQGEARTNGSKNIQAESHINQ